MINKFRRRLIISAPFGNYLNFTGCVSTLGTFTVPRRAGVLKRLWRFLWTVRYNRRQRSWINQLGLPNPGIADCPDTHGKILSVRGFDSVDWADLCWRADIIELNLGCPNIWAVPDVREVQRGVERAKNRKVIAKLPPVRWMDYVRPLWGMGVRTFHLCNTIPTPGGGISGKPLMQYSLWACREVRSEFPEAEIIGGGGVTSEDDVKSFVEAGADHVSIGSMLLNPRNWLKVQRLRYTLETI